MKITSSLFLFILISTVALGQIGDYNYQREIDNVSDQWHKISLPNSIFNKVNNDLSDIRIFGVKANNDTIEAPYILKVLTEESQLNKIHFLNLNEVHNTKGYFFTFEVPTSETINQINLDFSQSNFDWNITLQASMDNQEWFTVLEDYRIVSIKNNLTNYQFTKLSFPDSKYQYYRVLIPSNKKPNLSSATILLNKTKNASYINYKISKTNEEENQQNNSSIIDITLEEPVAISNLNIRIRDTFDYYRPITIKYLTDSIKTDKGWISNYRILTSGTLSSVEKKGFNFNSITTQKLKVIIQNNDNEPLTISDIQVKGYQHKLLVRFNEPADYFLVYGNKKSFKPKYDISQFLDKIPSDMNELGLLEEMPIKKQQPIIKSPLFENKLWLWITMGIIILVLGWFTLKMIKQ